MKIFLLILFLAVLSRGTLMAQQEANPNGQEVIYGHKDGMALSMFVFSPTVQANGKGIVFVVSGGFISSIGMLPLASGQVKPYLDRGYKIFAVLHGSVPKYTIPEIIPDIHRAVRFIRYHASAYRIDPQHLGISGASAGGHLALMIATADERIDTAATDPIDRVSSRVQAVTCFFPSTDLLNFGKPGGSIEPLLEKLRISSSVDFTRLDTATGRYEKITDPSKRTAIMKQISPLYQVSSDDPPILLVHGDNDPVVPLQQSELMIKKLNDSRVPSQLLIKKGGEHGWWPGMEIEGKACVDWFDKYLK